MQDWEWELQLLSALKGTGNSLLCFRGLVRDQYYLVHSQQQYIFKVSTGGWQVARYSYNFTKN